MLNGQEREALLQDLEGKVQRLLEASALRCDKAAAEGWARAARGRLGERRCLTHAPDAAASFPPHPPLPRPATARSGLPGGVLVQQCGRDAVLFEGHEQVLRVVNAAERRVPQLHSLRPLAVPTGYSGQLLLTGRHIGGSGDGIFCRRNGARRPRCPPTLSACRASSLSTPPPDPAPAPAQQVAQA